MVSFRLSTLVILIDTLSSSSSGTFQPLRIGRRGKRAVNGSGRIATWQILPVQLTIPLAGPAGEPVDLWRTLVSHGVAHLPPNEIDEDARTFRGHRRAPTRPAPDRPRHRGQARRRERRGARAEAPEPRSAARQAAADPQPGRGPVRLLRGRRRRRRPRLGGGRSGPDGAQPDRVRGRRQDEVPSDTSPRYLLSRTAVVASGHGRDSNWTPMARSEGVPVAPFIAIEGRTGARVDHVNRFGV